MPRESEQGTAIWPHDGHEDSLNPGVGEDDFSKFLDLDTDFQFADLDNGQSGLDTPMGRLGFGQHPHQATMQSLGFDQQQHLNMDLPVSSQGGFQPQLPTTQHFEPFQQYAHLPIGHSYNVPPTPISSEMQAAKYGQRMDNTGRLIFDQRQVSFTPLVSPAQTPIHGAYTMPEYGASDDFFSPLTSPAIEGKNPISSTASPVDNNDQAPKPSSAARRGRRKASLSTRTPAKSVKMSPVVKPLTRRRQASLNNNILPEQVDTQWDRPKSTRTLQPHVLGSNTQSSEGSVSPEALTEALMRPPPIPHSADRSPQHLAQVHASDSNGPVTPATLMRLPSKQGSHAKSHQSLVSDEGMEDIMLPDAAAPVMERPSLAELDTSRMQDDEESTPTLSAKSAKLSATSTPRSALGKTHSQDSFTKPAKVDNRPGRGGKKRQSTNSATISPALRPKISPNISPLVPASGPGMSHLSAETSALYLASKSNYQNIIDGTHLPGVSYPEALAENLSSKRTSHKIAEQGRRNRINLALKEIEGLLPPAITTVVGKRERAASVVDEQSDKPQSGQGASKASTVEMAIVYIKSLQAELQVTKDKLETAEKKLAEGNSSAESQTSD